MVTYNKIVSIYQNFGRMIGLGDLAGCDITLRKININKLNTASILAYLTASLPIKNNKQRKRFYQEAKSVLRERREKDLEELLKGLEYQIKKPNT